MPSWTGGTAGTGGSVVSRVGQKIISFGRAKVVLSGVSDQAGPKQGSTGAVAFEVVGTGARKMYGRGGHDGDMSSVHWMYHGFERGL